MANDADPEIGSKRNIILGYERVAGIEEAITGIRLMTAGMSSQLDMLVQGFKTQTREQDRLDSRVHTLETDIAVMKAQRGTVKDSLLNFNTLLTTATLMVSAYLAYKGLPH